MIMSVNISPKIFASWIPRGNVAITPQIFASWIPKGEISVKPMIFATYIPAPLAQNLTCDTFRSVEFLSGLASPKLKYKIGDENFSVDLFDEDKSVFGALALNFGNQKLFAELTETTAGNASKIRVKNNSTFAVAEKRLKTIPTFPTLTENIFLYTGNSVSPTFSNFNSSRMILSGETFVIKISAEKWIFASEINFKAFKIILHNFIPKISFNASEGKYERFRGIF